MHVRHYEVLNAIGNGSFATYYRAKKVKTYEKLLKGTIVALKAWEQKTTKKDMGELKKLASTETKIMKLVDSEHVVRLLSTFQFRRSHGLVLEFGTCSLQTVLEKRQKPFVDGEVKFYAWSILTGLAYIHRKGVVHRAIKPKNVILVIGADGSITPKIGEFGVAVRLNPGEKLPTDVRWNEYTAPEVWESFGHDWKCDIYSTGALMAEMLVPLALEEILRRPPQQALPIADVLLNTMVKTMTETDPKLRPTASEALRQAAFFYGFRPTRLSRSALEQEPNMAELEAEEAARDDAPVRWVLTSLEKVDPLEEDGPRQQVLRAIEEAVFEKIPPEGVTIFRCDAEEVEFAATRGQVDSKMLARVSGGVVSIFGGIPGNPFAEFRIAGEEGGPSSEASSEASVVGEEEKVVEEEPRDAGAPIAGEVVDELACSCGRQVDVRLLHICGTCLSKPHYETPLSALKQSLLCGQCVAAQHTMPEHTVLDAATVLLPKMHQEASEALGAARRVEEEEMKTTINELMKTFRRSHETSQKELETLQEHEYRTPSMAVKRKIQMDQQRILETMAKRRVTMTEAVKKAMEECGL